MNVVPWVFAAIIAALAPTPSPTERPLREIGRVRSSAYCTSFTNHFNAAVVPLLKNDFAVGLLDRSIDELEAHFSEIGGDVRIVDDRLRMADAVRRLQEAIPRAQSEINFLRDGAKLGSDPERVARVRDLASQLQTALDKHKQIAHDVGSVVHVLMEMSSGDARDDVFYTAKHAMSPDTPAVAAPALTGGGPIAAGPPLGTTLKELLRWSGQRDRIDQAESKAAAYADQIMTTTCGPVR